MGKRFWFGYLEGNGRGSLVLYDRQASSLAEDLVYLFHFKRDEIVAYKKDVVRRKLRGIDRYESSVTMAVECAYIEAMQRARRRSSRSLVLSEEDETYISAESDKLATEFYKEINREITEELWDYADSFSRSDEQGWYYDDSDVSGNDDDYR